MRGELISSVFCFLLLLFINIFLFIFRSGNDEYAKLFDGMVKEGLIYRTVNKTGFYSPILSFFLFFFFICLFFSF